MDHTANHDQFQSRKTWCADTKDSKVQGFRKGCIVLSDSYCSLTSSDKVVRGEVDLGMSRVAEAYRSINREMATSYIAIVLHKGCMRRCKVKEFHDWFERRSGFAFRSYVMIGGSPKDSVRKPWHDSLVPDVAVVTSLLCSYPLTCGSSVFVGDS